jgi:HSP20 family protein
MERYDPFEEMDRMFEQLRTRMWTPERRLGGDRRGDDRRRGEFDRRDESGTDRRDESGTDRREREMPRRDDWMTTREFGPSRRELGMPRRESRPLRREDRLARSDGVGMDLKRRDDAYVFVADLPGFEREDIDLGFEDGMLTLDAESETRDERTDDEGEIAIRGEFTSTRRIAERVTVPAEVDEDAIEATFHNGVLEVHLPLLTPDEGDGGKRIDIGK